MPKTYPKQANPWTAEWEICVDGTAYFGQRSEEGMKDGYGKLLSIYGEFIKAYFDEDEIQHGLVISADGDYYYFDRLDQKAEESGGKKPDHRNCFTKAFYPQNLSPNKCEGWVKGGYLEGQARVYFDVMLDFNSNSFYHDEGFDLDLCYATIMDAHF